MSDRTEAMLTDNAGRDLVSTAELAFDADYRITAYRVHILSNLGAYNSQFGQAIQSSVSSKVLTGVYDIPAAFVNAQGVYTNTAPVDAYRGAGRPEAIYTLERAMDQAARVLGMDPWELRRRNFMPPMLSPIAHHRARPTTWAISPRAGAGARRGGCGRLCRPPWPLGRRGRLRGLGLCYYIEAILGDPTEGASVVFARTVR
jgi:aerobic carbon-monoxide dehydrogenase large subunit